MPPPWRVNRAYQGLCAAVAVSDMGDWLLFIALPLYVLRVSGSAFDTSAVFLAELVPAVVVGATCGVLIDRWSPGRLLAGLTGLQALVVLPLLWAGPGRVWLVFAVAGVQAAFTSLTMPAQQAVVPLLVAPDEISGANAIVQLASSAARLIGSPLGGVLLPVLGLRGLVIADAASFLVSAVLLRRTATASPPPLAPAAGPLPRGRLIEVAEGWRAARRSRTLMAAVAISFLAAVAQGLFLLLFVLFVLRSLHAGDQLVGLLRGVQAIGGVLGALLVGTRAKHVPARTLAVGGLAAFALISALCWNSPVVTTAPWWYVALFIAVGAPGTALSTGLVTVTQQASPVRVRGRVLSLVAVAQALGQGTGILAAGLLSAAAPLTVLLNAQAGCYLTCAVIALTSLQRHPIGPANDRGDPSSGAPAARVSADRAGPRRGAGRAPR